jgi:predicted CxxxxCH...CXXCH cytochrome family protein
VIGTGGARATGGTIGSGGSTATGGTTGTGGAQATGGTTGSGGAGTSGAPTFTQVYQTILTVSCGGSQCHSPGTQGNVSFASQSSAYSAVKSRVVAGNASSFSFYTVVNGGRMPPNNKLPAAQIAQIAAWINAGALNN